MFFSAIRLENYITSSCYLINIYIRVAYIYILQRGIRTWIISFGVCRSGLHDVIILYIIIRDTVNENSKSNRNILHTPDRPSVAIDSDNEIFPWHAYSAYTSKSLCFMPLFHRLLFFGQHASPTHKNNIILSSNCVLKNEIFGSKPCAKRC